MFALLATVVAAEILQPGTQPGDLQQPLRPPAVCVGCHGSYSEDSAFDTWAGSMMANAARDPLFWAAIAVANQDVPGSGDLCLRCHTPPGWLSGRSEPPDGTSLLEEDFEGVQCDFCHRLEGDKPLISNARYRVADDFVRRGPLKDAVAPHEVRYSSYFEESRLCGLCHDVSNPLEGGFAIERTYTEWATSAFPAEGATCQSCHLPAVPGFASGAPGMPERMIHRHDFAGGNTWMPMVIAAEYPELERQAAYERTSQHAREMLERAAEVTVNGEVDEDELRITVRVENLTGHKLPTGYPEGRRSWLEVRVTDARGEVMLHSGAYDAEAADRVDDPQLRTYEVRMAADGEEGFHFMRQDQLLQDNRIPPRGFVPNAQTAPVGRAYARLAGGALAHWDEAPYVVDVSGGRGPFTVEATLWYQTVSREYVEFLREENRTNDAGERMHRLWEEHDRAPPVAMAAAHAELGTAAGDGCAIAGKAPRFPPVSVLVLFALSTGLAWRKR